MTRGWIPEQLRGWTNSDRCEAQDKKLERVLTTNRLPRVLTVLARLTILFVVFPEADYQARNDHGRFVWVYAEMMAKYVDYSTVKNVSENSTDGRERDRAMTYIAQNAPDTDHRKDGREQVPKRTPSARAQHRSNEKMKRT